MSRENQKYRFTAKSCTEPPTFLEVPMLSNFPAKVKKELLVCGEQSIVQANFVRASFVKGPTQQLWLNISVALLLLLPLLLLFLSLLLFWSQLELEFSRIIKQPVTMPCSPWLYAYGQHRHAHQRCQCMTCFLQERNLPTDICKFHLN